MSSVHYVNLEGESPKFDSKHAWLCQPAKEELA
jgi:hypothetical protein